MEMFLLRLFISVQIVAHSVFAYKVPDVIFKALKPKGFEAAIPDEDGIELFAFHGKLNGQLEQQEPGDLTADIMKPKNGFWRYSNPDLQLKQNDFISYWVFVQYKGFGYRRDNLNWTVSEFADGEKSGGDMPCRNSQSFGSRSVSFCQGAPLINDQFSNTNIQDDQYWQVERFIPQDPDYEFCYYSNEAISVNANEGLVIKPIVTNIQGVLDLKDSCTRESLPNCYQDFTYFYKPPVISGRLVSKLKFHYGKIEIQAQLPLGDWIYPQIYLESVQNTNYKIWIAYARGNEELKGNDGKDIGGSLLFGGIVRQSGEPERSKYLGTKKFPNHLSDKIHTFTVEWRPDYIKFLVDNQEYYKISSESLDNINFPRNDLFRLVLGVGVGGINDFPNDFVSKGYKKPWTDKARQQIKSFYETKHIWQKTWTKAFLQVKKVAVIAI